MSSLRFDGQVIVITGGSGGIGIAVANRLGKEGAKLALLDVSRKAVEDAVNNLKSQSIEVESFLCDVTKEIQVNKVFDKIKRQLGKIDALVNTAGITGKTGCSIEDVPFSDFLKVCAININGTFLTNKAALKIFSETKYGRICNIASIAGKEGNAGMSSYSCSKAAVIGLTKCLGKEYAEKGDITVNSIAPAVVKTPILDSISKRQIEYMTSKIPMKRCGKLDEIAALISWIVSKECSFTTGFCFDLTGGRATY